MGRFRETILQGSKNITRKSIVDKIHVDIDRETHILVTEQQRIDEEM